MRIVIAIAILSAPLSLADGPIAPPLRCPTTMGPMEPRSAAKEVPDALRGLWQVSTGVRGLGWIWLAKDVADCRLLRTIKGPADGPPIFEEVGVPLVATGGIALDIQFVGDVHLTWSLSLAAATPGKGRLNHTGSGRVMFQGPVVLTKRKQEILASGLRSGYALCLASRGGEKVKLKVLRAHRGLGVKAAETTVSIPDPWKALGLKPAELVGEGARCFVRLERRREGQQLKLIKGGLEAILDRQRKGKR